ncbi:MAG: hypothetical protein SOY32_05320 [Candidatus Faecousia sp.]|nr:hypothetical protein [Bacillota bacterium]MDY4219823.1 hypothetical protein [Candidatus Faecousia sp.]
MNRIVMTTKKTNIAFLASSLISSLLFFGLGIYLMNLSDRAWGQNATTLKTAAVTLWIVALVHILVDISFATSYADVYEDRIVGKGIQQLFVREFNLDYGQITDISCTGGRLYISTPGGKYKIITNAAKAKEVFDYYNHAIKTPEGHRG